jgi:small subunit ribosomal protein S3
MEKGAKGIKVRISGRIGGAEIARHEVYKEGNIPTQTIKASIDYSVEHALTHVRYHRSQDLDLQG